MTSSIDSSLAKGIRRAYLQEIEKSFEKLIKIRKQKTQRNPNINISSKKSLNKEIDKLRMQLKHAGITHTEFLVNLSSRVLWASLFISRENFQNSNSRKGLNPRGYARVNVLAASYPADEWLSKLNIKITGHAIDRVIQRIKILNLPIKQDDVQAISTELSQSLAWAASTFFVLSKLDINDAKNLKFIYPTQHGFFLAGFYYQKERPELIITTYINRNNTWDEQVEALATLDGVSDAAIAFFAAHIISPSIIQASHDINAERIFECWRNFGWRLQEKSYRPGKIDTKLKNLYENF